MIPTSALRLGAPLLRHTAALRTPCGASLRHCTLSTSASTLASSSRLRLSSSPAVRLQGSIRRSFQTSSRLQLRASSALLSSSPPSPPASPPPSLRSRIAPYLALARLSRPIGTWLLFWPSAFSLALGGHYLALPPSIALGYTALFGIGAVVMRGAGCTINDLWDRELDRKVARTATRPLAAGLITPRQALVFLGAQLGVGLCVLLQLNWYSIALGAASLIPVTIYPLMKRITYWPQAVLGLTFNWGALLGYASLSSALHLPLVLPLYAGTIAWTLVYDTIYAHQDAADDVSVGIKSTALLFGNQTKPVLSGFAALFLSGTAVSIGSIGGGTLLANLAAQPASCAALAAAATHIAWQIGSVDLKSREDCWRKFESNRDLGALLWAGMMCDYVAAVGWS